MSDQLLAIGAAAAMTIGVLVTLPAMLGFIRDNFADGDIYTGIALSVLLGLIILAVVGVCYGVYRWLRA